MKQKLWGSVFNFHWRNQFLNFTFQSCPGLNISIIEPPNEKRNPEPILLTLTIHNHKPSLTSKFISLQKPCHRYCLLFNSSRHGIERLEICETKEDKNPKIITLENCVKITQESSPANLIQIVKKTGTLTLNTLTDEDLKEWVNALQMIAFRDRRTTHGTYAVIEEDNDLYCSSFGDGLFIITLIPSDTSIRCSIEPKAYMLHLTSTELQLKSADNFNVVVAKWPYRFIRKYGYRDGKFTFEAGRKCSTGEGVFTLNHSNPQEVFRCMSSKMKSMKKLISGDSINSIECGENQLNIAAAMEAGSRSPLPPSPSNQIFSDFELSSTQNCLSLRGFISSSDSLNNFSAILNTNNFTSPPPTQLKHIPNKTPRKLPSGSDKLVSQPTPVISNPTITELKSAQQNCDKLNKINKYAPFALATSIDPSKPSSPEVLRKSEHTPPDLPIRNESAKNIMERDYESITSITDAWKTLGVNDVKHTERNAAGNHGKDIIDFAWERSLSQREKGSSKEPIPPVKIPKIIDIDFGEGGSYISSIATDCTYDRLDFLSPNNKSSSGYKTILTVTASPNRLRASSSSANDYELIASPDIKPCRKADDSHLGYGVLRKSTSNLIKTAQITNNSNDDNQDKNADFAETDFITTTKSPTKVIEPILDHRSYNGLNYTVVSKPKRV